MSGEEWKNKLYFGDNLAILREHVPDESVDLVYLDPPFNSKATYNVLFSEKNGTESAAQITAFEDTWHWGIETEEAFQEVVKQGGKIGTLLDALRQFLGTNDMMAYLTMMAIRLVDLHGVLKPTGSIYLHCDPTASHYLKLLLDAVFGARNFRNEIIWKRMTPSGFKGKTSIGRSHDIILLYTRSDRFLYNPVYIPYSEEYIKERFSKLDEHGRRFKDEKIGTATSAKTIARLKAEGRIYVTSKGKLRIKHFVEDAKGVPLDDVWYDIPPINSQASERLGYPTQKPEALLERIIQASSDEGDVVLDPFCGCGTAIAVAERLHRRWIGIDITHLAITLMRHRLRDTFDDDLTPYEVIGDPKDLESARTLALQDRYQFEWWTLGLVDARPEQDKKKGADKGVDGHIYFFDDRSGKAKEIVVQVKSGHVGLQYIHELRGVIEREKAAIGVFITLEEPTGPMVKEAVTAGFYQPKDFPAKQCPRIQIFTIKELLEGKKVEYPRLERAATFKQATRKRKQPKDKMDSLLTESG